MGTNIIWLEYKGDYAIYDLTYITLAVYLKHKAMIKKLINDFDFIYGIYYSYNISAKQKWVIEAPIPLDTGPQNFRDEINNHELGYSLGFKLPFFERKLFFGIIYNNALTKLYKGTYQGYLHDFGR